LAGLSAGDAAETSPATLHGKGKIMIKAKLTKEFFGAPDGEHHPRAFHPGDEISGDLATAAIDAGYAVPLDGGAKAGQKKALGDAPRNKSAPSSASPADQALRSRSAITSKVGQK
jgi:hypothetical protein